MFWKSSKMQTVVGQNGPARIGVSGAPSCRGGGRGAATYEGGCTSGGDVARAMDAFLNGHFITLLFFIPKFRKNNQDK